METRNVCLNGVSIVRYTKCCCGSITLEFDNGADSSMYLETFEQLGLDLSEAEEGQKTCCCNHCANRWGIDLCECGSGEREIDVSKENVKVFAIEHHCNEGLEGTLDTMSAGGFTMGGDGEELPWKDMIVEDLAMVLDYLRTGNW